MWTEIPLPKLPYPIRAIGLPWNGESLAIWTETGLFRVRLTKEPAVFSMATPERAEDLFQSDRGVFISHGNVYHMVGDCGRFGILSDPEIQLRHPQGDRIVIHDEILEVVDAVNETLLSIPFDRNSKLRVAGMRDGMGSNFLTVCTTDYLRVFRYSQSQTGKKAVWQQTADPVSQVDLMRAICEKPNDDGPRLIYADWLDEKGDSDRASFIRLQCELAVRERTDYVMPDDAARVEIDRLITTSGEQWLAEYPKLKGTCYFEFWRGFPKLSLTSPTLATQKKHVEQLRQTVPVSSLEFHCYTTADVQKVERWPFLSNVRDLKLSFVDIQSAPTINAAAKLLTGGLFTELQRLTLRRWTPQLVKKLFEKHDWPNLERIEFGIEFHNDSQDLLILNQKDRFSRLRTVVCQTSFYQPNRFQKRVLKPLAKRIAHIIHEHVEQGGQITATRIA